MENAIQITHFTDSLNRDWIYGDGQFFSVEYDNEMYNTDVMVCIHCDPNTIPRMRSDGALMGVRYVRYWANTSKDQKMLKDINEYFNTDFKYDPEYGLNYLRPTAKLEKTEKTFRVHYWGSNLNDITGFEQAEIITKKDLDKLIDDELVNIMIYHAGEHTQSICMIDDIKHRFQTR